MQEILEKILAEVQETKENVNQLEKKMDKRFEEFGIAVDKEFEEFRIEFDKKFEDFRIEIDRKLDKRF